MFVIARNVKHYRKKKNLTQEGLGEKSGIMTSAISNLETQKRLPTFPTLKKISIALHVTMDKLTSEFIKD